MKFEFIHEESVHYPSRLLCSVLGLSTSAYFDWCKRPGKLIEAETLHLHRRTKQLFKDSRGSLGNREMMKSFGLKALI